MLRPFRQNYKNDPALPQRDLRCLPGRALRVYLSVWRPGMTNEWLKKAVFSKASC